MTLDAAEVKAAVAGRWRPTIVAAGCPDERLDGGHHPCPRCGGKDRFRAFEDFDETGGVICNQCFAERNGDGFAAIQWLRQCSFPDAVRFVAEHCNVPVSQNGKATERTSRTPRAKVSPVEWDDRLVATWCAAKAPADVQAAKNAAAFLCHWPTGGPSRQLCIAFPASRNGRDECGLDLYRLDGQPFPELTFGTTTLGERKDHNVGGSKDGWVVVGGWERFGRASVVWKAEGITDALALAPHVPADHVVVTNIAGAKGAAKCVPSIFRGKVVRTIGDADVPGMDGARSFCRTVAKHATDVRLVPLPFDVEPKHGKDVRDYLLAGGTFDDLVKLADEAESFTAADTAVESIDVPHEYPADPDARVRVLVTPDEYETNVAAATSLAKDETLFQRAGLLVRILDVEGVDHGVNRGGSPTIAEAPTSIVREALTRQSRFLKERETETSTITEQCHPPDWCTKAVAERGEWPGMRRLAGIATTPVLRPDGTVLDEPGFDEPTGLFYRYSGTPPTLPSSPTREDALRAVELLKDVVVDFPFAKPAHRSTWLAGLLTTFARPAIAGPCPLFLVDAPVPGAGKGKLVHIVGILQLGRSMATSANTTKDEEIRKRITSIALAGDPVVLIDNVEGQLGTPSLDAALTGEVWQDRLLSTNTTIQLPIRTVWWATGNNVTLRQDTARRTAHVRIDPKCENPDERTGFKYPNLEAHVRRHRAELITAALVILRAYVVAGQPAQRLAAWGSFDDWSNVVRAPLVWLGEADPADAREELRRDANSEAAAVAALFAVWPMIAHNGDRLTTAEVIERGKSIPEVLAALCEVCPPKPNADVPTSRQLGNKLRRLRARVIGGKYIEDQKDRKGFSVWTIQSAESAESADSTPHPTREPNQSYDVGESDTFGSREGWAQDSADSADSADDWPDLDAVLVGDAGSE